MKNVCAIGIIFHLLINSTHFLFSPCCQATNQASTSPLIHFHPLLYFFPFPSLPTSRVWFPCASNCVWSPHGGLESEKEEKKERRTCTSLIPNSHTRASFGGRRDFVIHTAIPFPVAVVVDTTGFSLRVLAKGDQTISSSHLQTPKPLAHRNVLSISDRAALNFVVIRPQFS